MATQLGLYNEALRLLGERQLADLNESRESRRVLDNIWNDGAVDACLEQGYWNFALRAAELSPSSAVTPSFGFTYAFEHPTDWLRTAGISGDENFNTPLTHYLEEVGYWLADVDPLYVRYVSNDASYGNDLTHWPQTFSKFVAAFLASEAAFALVPDTKAKQIYALMVARRTDARSKDAMNDPTAFPPQGSWVSARQGGRSGQDRGKRGKLIG